MKKINWIICLVLALISFSPSVLAATGSIKVSSNKSTVIVGDSVKVTVNVSSSDLGAWQYCISYDSSILKLTDSDADANTCVKTGYVQNKNQKSATNTFTFKALKSGSSTVTVKSYAVYDYTNEAQMKTDVNSLKIKTMTQAELEATYSTNAYLKSLTVGSYTLDPSFKKDVYDYTVEVPNEVTSVNISATKDDAASQVSGSGTKDLTEGDNKFEIVVTAQKGNSLTYKINVYRKELDPISVSINGEEYFIIRKDSALINYSTYEATTIKYEEFEIPALHSDITDYTLVGLKDSESNIAMYIYQNGEFIKYNEIKSNALTIYPQELPENDYFKGFVKKEITYNDIKMSGYALTNDANRVIIYAQNIETGNVQYFEYDINNNVIVEFDKELMEFYNKKMEIMKYIIFGLIGVSIFLLFLLIVIKPKTKIVYKEVSEEKENMEDKTKKDKKKK